jgi:hypothetical protein
VTPPEEEEEVMATDVTASSWAITIVARGDGASGSRARIPFPSGEAQLRGDTRCPKPL